MNCRHFRNELFEYVEGTFSADTLAAAQEHLTECDSCRRAVEKEIRFTTALSSHFRQSSQSLTLHPEIRRNVLSASRQKAPVPTLAESLVNLPKYWVHVTAIPLAALLVVGILMAIHFSGSGKHETVLVPVTPRLTKVSSPVSVQISYRIPRHEFRQDGNTVVDAFVDETVVVNETIPSSSVKNPPQKPEIKTSL